MDAEMDSIITNTGVNEKYTMKQETNQPERYITSTDYAKLNRRRNCLKGRMNRVCQDLEALIPPWNGGYWERIVPTVKESLKKVLGNTRMKEDELRTVLCEREARINSRPLTFVGDYPNDPNPLTP
ncbi:hypothetical protein T02_4773 [Trichinella nativa]|uniref:Uncharacterized protein n=1 Tax=Trichinella nativa TaxID=6335 RepID=A0A0V1KWR6_9BILA|nr:hypothetical protein T02_4773 [Trichinella nativa]